MKVQILPSASLDLVEGYQFYEKQAESVGVYFLDSLFADIDALVLKAGIHPMHGGDYHRMLSKRFPFAVYYKIESDTAVVYAVLDCRRDPAWTRSRLQQARQDEPG